MSTSPEQATESDEQTIEKLVEFFRQGVKPHHVILAILASEQPVRIRHERGKLVLHPEELIDRVVMPLPFFALGLYLQKPIEHVRGKLLRAGLAIEWILAKLRQIALPALELALLLRRRFVVKFSVMAGDAELFHQTKRGEYLRVIEENFGEDLFVKKIQAPWPEPN